MTTENNGVKTDDPNAPKDQDGVNTQSAPTGDDNQIDYKAELERIQAERDNYKQGLLNAKDKLKQLKKGQSDDEDEDIDDDDEINTRVNKIVEEKLEGLKKDVNSATVETILDSISVNSDEKELIRFHYENSIKQSGSSANDIRNDLENARLVANRKKLLAENTALKDALLANGSMTSAGAGSGSIRPSLNEVKLSPSETTLFNRTNANRQSRGLKPLTPQEFASGN
jgi:hypothetical protein